MKLAKKFFFSFILLGNLFSIQLLAEENYIEPDISQSIGRGLLITTVANGSLAPFALLGNFSPKTVLTWGTLFSTAAISTIETSEWQKRKKDNEKIRREKNRQMRKLLAHTRLVQNSSSEYWEKEFEHKVSKFKFSDNQLHYYDKRKLFAELFQKAVTEASLGPQRNKKFFYESEIAAILGDNDFPENIEMFKSIFYFYGFPVKKSKDTAYPMGVTITSKNRSEDNTKTAQVDFGNLAENVFHQIIMK